MCRVATAELEAELTSATLARRWIAHHLYRWELHDWTDTVTLLASELVTNAVVHTGSGPVITVAVAAGVVEVGVTDRDPRLPRPGASSSAPDREGEAFMAEGGRGLALVDIMATEWGTTSLTDGKHVWLRLDATAWSYRAECRCHRDAAGRIRLPSGLEVLALPGPWDHLPPSGVP